MTQTAYQIEVEGHLDPRRSEWFDGWSIAHQENGSTVLTGSVEDQPALHGILAKVRDLNLILISAQRVQIDNGGKYESASEPNSRSIRRSLGDTTRSL